MHPSGSYFSARRKEAAHCGRFGALETNTLSKMARGRHGCFSAVFHLLCKVSSDYRKIKQKELYYLSFKTVLGLLVVMFYPAFGKFLTSKLMCFILLIRLMHNSFNSSISPLGEFSTL